MNAKEAREQAFKVNMAEFNDQYNKVKNEISIAVKKGNYKTYIYEELKSSVKELLIQEGFVITPNFDQKDGITITIAW